MKINLKKVASGLTVSAFALVSMVACAAPVDVDVNVTVPGAYQPPQPIYVTPRPVYIEERPVYVEHEDGYWDCKKDKCKQKKLKKEKRHKHDREDD
jgi:hypothetical protein